MLKSLRLQKWGATTRLPQHSGLQKHLDFKLHRSMEFRKLLRKYSVQEFAS
jgi:hypothetical protein